MANLQQQQQEQRVKLVDLHEILVDFANNFKTVKDLRKRADLHNIRDEDIDISRLKIESQPTKYSGLSETPPIAKSQLVFGSVLINDTSSPQKLSLSSTRRTTSTCRVMLQRALTTGKCYSVTLSAPSSIASANAAFRRDLTLTNTSEETLQEELTWTINCDVNVAGHSKTTARIKIDEAELSGSFTIDTLLSGRIMIMMRDKKSGEKLAPIIVPDISQIFTKDRGFLPVPGQRGCVKFTQSGSVYCRFGINQTVRFKEQPLTIEDKLEEEEEKVRVDRDVAEQQKQEEEVEQEEEGEEEEEGREGEE